MGTPEFAVASLDALVQAGCHIVGVVTAPDKAAGRRHAITAKRREKNTRSKRPAHPSTR